jgi:hypothetical protein
MLRFAQPFLGGLVPLCAVWLAITGAAARAADIEVRDFITRIDGKPAGDYHMTITRHDDGSLSLAGQAAIKVTKLGITVYHYSFTGSEVWKNGRLQRLQANTDDDGTGYAVNATAERDGLRVRINGTDRMTRADVWVTSYWQLPVAAQRTGTIPLMESDNGEAFNGTIQYLGTTPLNVAGRPQNCAHYRVTCKLTVDLWYDAQDRLVRREWVEDGHRVQLELAGIRR